MKTKLKIPSADLLRRMDAFWWAANYLPRGRIYFYDKTVCRVLGLG
jgi:phosphoketolase